ncbi:MAG: hypothetical protein ACFFAH_15240 [Promethearchaeota archaeon]
MSKNSRLIFCFYCGNLIKEYDYEETKICPYCGIELHYIDKKIKGKKPNKSVNL